MLRPHRTALTLPSTLLLGLAPTSLAHGQAERVRGVLVMAHGGDAAWNRVVERTVEPLRSRWPIEIAWGMADPDAMEQALDRLAGMGVRDVAVVRLFVSGESFLERTKQILGLAPLPEGASHAGPEATDSHDTNHARQRRDDPMRHHFKPVRRVRFDGVVRLSEQGLADWPLVGRILADRVAALSSDPSRESVLVIAHGPGDDAENARWLSAMEARLEAVRRLGPFREVRCETLREDWPDKRAAAEARIRAFVAERTDAGERVLVVPFRVAGFGPYAEVLSGLSYVADGRGLCPHPLVTRWLAEQAEALFEEQSQQQGAAGPR